MLFYYAANLRSAHTSAQQNTINNVITRFYSTLTITKDQTGHWEVKTRN